MILVACAADAESAKWNEVKTETFGEVPYNIVYTSNGDGTCAVTDIRIDKDHTEDIHLVIPEYAPNGDLVIEIKAGFDNGTTLNLPRYMTTEGYKAACENISKAEETNGLDPEHDAKIFESFYALKTTDSGKQYYMFEPYAFYKERLRVSSILKDYGYTEEDCYNELMDFVESIPSDEEKTDMTRDAFKFIYSNGKNITEITIPKSVKYLGYGVFNGCDNLKKVNGLREDLMIMVHQELKTGTNSSEIAPAYLSVLDENIKDTLDDIDNDENEDFINVIG